MTEHSAVFAIASYWSLRDLVVVLEKLSVVPAPMGAATQIYLYRVRLLADIAQGRGVSSIAGEGGIQSTLGADPEFIAQSVKRGD